MKTLVLGCEKQRIHATMEKTIGGPQQTTERTTSSTVKPRVTWTTLHAVGFGLLWIAGAWQPLAPPCAIEVLALATICFYAAASLVDPGYLERQLPDDEQLPPQHADSIISSSTGSAVHPLLELPTCVHCRAHQVARAKHCHDCGRCVRRLDHHCWWLGSCVGKGNHRLFLTYLALEASLLISIGATAAARGLAVSDAQRAASAPWPVAATGAALTCIAMSAILGLLTLTLLAFQCSLILRGETTWEHLRRERINTAMLLPPHVRPYDRGPWRNVAHFCVAEEAPRGAAVVSSCSSSAAPLTTAVPLASGAPLDASSAPRRMPHEPPYGL